MAVVEYFKRFGITTGAAAASAAKAAALAVFRGEVVDRVVIPTPVGLRIEVPVEEVSVHSGYACAKVRKFAGDNPDVLDGAEFVACVYRCVGCGVEVEGGEGVGVAVSQGLKVEPGQKYISPTARRMIAEAVSEVVGEGVRVVVHVPRGRELARLTMNPDLGIEGGIAILGTTGIEMPMSDEEFVEHVEAEIRAVARLKGTSLIVLASGNTTYKLAKAAYGGVVVKVGDWVGRAVEAALREGFRRIVVVSMPGKAVKLAAGLLNTHSRYGDARIEAVTHAAVLAGVDYETLAKIARSRSVAEAVAHLGRYAGRVFEVVAARIHERISKLGGASFGVLILGAGGEVLGKAGEV